MDVNTTPLGLADTGFHIEPLRLLQSPERRTLEGSVTDHKLKIQLCVEACSTVCLNHTGFPAQLLIILRTLEEPLASLSAKGPSWTFLGS